MIQQLITGNYNTVRYVIRSAYDFDKRAVANAPVSIQHYISHSLV